MLAFHTRVTRAIFQKCVLQLSVVNEIHYQSTRANEFIATIFKELTPSNSPRCQQRIVKCFLYEELASKICLFKFVNSEDIYLGLNWRGLTKCKKKLFFKVLGNYGICETNVKYL